MGLMTGDLGGSSLFTFDMMNDLNLGVLPWSRKEEKVGERGEHTSELSRLASTYGSAIATVTRRLQKGERNRSRANSWWRCAGGGVAG